MLGEITSNLLAPSGIPLLINTAGKKWGLRQQKQTRILITIDALKAADLWKWFSVFTWFMAAPRWDSLEKLISFSISLFYHSWCWQKNEQFMIRHQLCVLWNLFSIISIDRWYIKNVLIFCVRSVLRCNWWNIFCCCRRDSLCLGSVHISRNALRGVFGL